MMQRVEASGAGAGTPSGPDPLGQRRITVGPEIVRKPLSTECRNSVWASETKQHPVQPFGTRGAQAPGLTINSEQLLCQDDGKVIQVHKPLVLRLSKDGVSESVWSSTLRQAQGSPSTNTQGLCNRPANCAGLLRSSLTLTHQPHQESGEPLSMAQPVVPNMSGSIVSTTAQITHAWWLPSRISGPL